MTSMESDTMISIISTLMSKDLYLNGKVLKARKVTFDDERGDEFVSSLDVDIKDGKLVLDIFPEGTNSEGILEEYLESPLIPVIMKIEYPIYPGPFDYDELRRQCSDAYAFCIEGHGEDAIEWTIEGKLPKYGNRNLARFGIYDSNKPIPKCYRASDGSKDIYVLVVYFPDTVKTIGG